MKVKNLLLLLMLLTVSNTFAVQKPSVGKLVEITDLQSEYLSNREAVVWLPSDYSPKKKYAVIYMHDGQMLFDATDTWNHQEWKIDEVADQLQKEGEMQNTIVVAVSNVAETRYHDYFPEKVLDYLPANTISNEEKSKFAADDYLKFIVNELKPYVDKNYPTQRDARHTFVMGSSMGGLISLYALCEYPNVFGGAACLSTHSVMVNHEPSNLSDVDVWAKAFRDYLEENLPKANSKIVYMDRGDATLDAFYEETQAALDELFKNKGWESPYYVSKVFPGAAHMEKDWAKRLANPFLALAARKDAEKIERIDPPFWWTGMKNTELQLMVYGTNISLYEPSLDYPGVEIKSVESLESPNYILLYLDVENAQPGKFNITFTQGKKKLVHEYELKERNENAAAKVGFDSSDVIYLLMPDRFANGNPDNDTIPMSFPYELNRKDVSARHGGDLQGITDKADYLADLGVTALWTTPVLENDMHIYTYHGYAATDYYKIDARLGSNQDYADMVSALHQRGIKVIMDMVFNHCGLHHPWLKDLPSADWVNNNEGKYVGTNHDKNVYFDPYAAKVDRDMMTDGWFVPEMPDLNQRNKHLEKYMIQNSIWWIEFADLNGIRQDTYPYPHSPMMARWCKAVFDEYPNLNIVGEVMTPNPIATAYWQDGSRLNKDEKTGLKTVMDFHLQAIASKAFSEETYWAGGMQTIFEHFTYDFCYEDINNVMRLLENHDTDRFLPEEPKDLNAFKQATALLLTIPGIPQIYYGFEFAFSGSARVDYGFIRPDMPGGWEGDQADYFNNVNVPEIKQEAFNYIKKVLNWRKGNKVISAGTMKHYVPREGVYVYERSLGGKTVMVVMNGMEKAVELPMQPYAETLKGRVNGKDIITEKNFNLSNTLNLKAKDVLILELQN